MKKEELYETLEGIDEKFIHEAETVRFAKKKPVWKKLIAVAACFCLIAVGAIPFLGGYGGNSAFTITAFAYGTNEEITAAGVALDTGTISDSGGMSGHPLMFYLVGEGIKTVRFSCKNQQINFMDWTEKRDEFGEAQNFTVPYGADQDEYYYLTVDWVPNALIRELTDHDEISIENLAPEMRNDVIVMEITYADGTSAVKAITVSLQDDGTFYASFDDYKISTSDDFLQRPDCEPILRNILYSE